MSAPRPLVVVAGQITDFSGNPVDPCNAYVNFTAGCPTSVVGVGIPGRKDIIPIKTLLQAARIESLDQAAGSDANETLRLAGTVIVINIEYSNFYTETGSFDPNDVRYFYRVSAVPSAEYKAETAFTQDGTVMASQRIDLNRHGVRIVISFSGNVGWFDAQTLLINLTVSLGLLSVAVIVIDTVATMCCPLRHVYRQYKERATVDFSDIRKVDKAEYQSMLSRFQAEEHMIDPVPRVFEDLMGHEKAWRSGSRRWEVQKAEIDSTGSGSSVAVVMPAGSASAASHSDADGARSAISHKLQAASSLHQVQQQPLASGEGSAAAAGSPRVSLPPTTVPNPLAAVAAASLPTGGGHAVPVAGGVAAIVAGSGASQASTSTVGEWGVRKR